MTEQRRLAAIVSADVAGYSRLMGHDESAMPIPTKPPGCNGIMAPGIAE
jgi:hypothetical protein